MPEPHLGLQDDATGKILAAQFFPSETALGYLTLLRQLLRRHGTPLAFYGVQIVLGTWRRAHIVKFACGAEQFRMDRMCYSLFCSIPPHEESRS
jgi:hypothetical protein